MKNLLMAFFMNRDKNTESMKPIIISTLARAVFFPDGKSLLTKWEEEIKSSVAINHKTEVTEDDTGSSYKWSCTTFGETKYQLIGHFRPSIANSPTSINGEGVQSSITITKKDSEGNVTEEVIPYGTNSSIKQYRYVIPVPVDFANGKICNFATASINITEGSESDFLLCHTFHNMYAEYANGNLSIYVNHYNGMDAVDMSNLLYVTGDFNVSIDGLFV